MTKDDRWRGWENAEIYDRFARERRLYPWLNARLVERAALESAHRVLDLGCGTGATAQACLQRLPAEAALVGVDASPEMVEVARAQTLDPRASFVVSDASVVAEVVEGRFDRVVSNAAFWQFPRRERVLEAIVALTEPGALVVLNVPSERIEGRTVPFHPFQLALARAIEEQTGEPFARTATAFDPDAFLADARGRGLAPVAVDQLTYEGRQGEFMELMTIPAMIAPLTREMPSASRAEVLERAIAAVSPDDRVHFHWTYITLRRS